MSEWISIKDRIPEMGRDVLLFDADIEEVGSGYISTKHWVRYRPDGIENTRVTYWMPLPDPPK